MIVNDWMATHALDKDQHQATFNDFYRRGYRQVKISAYDDGGTPRYASLWFRQDGNEWLAQHGMDEAEFLQSFELNGQDNFRPIDLSVVRSGGETRFSVIWEQESGSVCLVRHRLTAEEYQAASLEFSGQGYRLRCVSPYNDGEGERFAAIWDQYAGPPWFAQHGIAPGDYQAEFLRHRNDGFRLIRAVGYDSGFGVHFATIWEQSRGHPWWARAGVSIADYQSEFDESKSTRLLVDVSGYRDGDSVSFTTIWEEGEWASERVGPVADLVVPFMQKWTVPGLSFAISQNGILSKARCFGYANRITREIVEPRSRFRVASVSKPITSTAIHVLIERGDLSLTDKAFGGGGVLGTTYGTKLYYPRLLQVTVQHLLEHTAGGWGIEDNDPMFAEPGKSQSELISWTLDERQLGSDPGSVYAYSNFGYCLLGRIIEKVSATSYAKFVQSHVLGPSGVLDMVLAEQTALGRAYFEPMYFGFYPESPYGLPIERMDAHGGWVGSPTDLLNFLARVDGVAYPADILKSSSIDTMTTPSTVEPVSPDQAGYAQGWVVTEAGTVFHNGELEGTEAILVRVADGRQWCGVCSAGRPPSEMRVQFDDLMWKVQPVA